MNKKSKWIIICLAAAFCVSLSFNIVQCSESHKDTAPSKDLDQKAAVDTLEIIIDDNQGVLSDQSGQTVNALSAKGSTTCQKTKKGKVKENANNQNKNTPGEFSSGVGATAGSEENLGNSETNPLQQTLNNNKKKLEKSAQAKAKAEKENNDK